MNAPTICNYKNQMITLNIVDFLSGLLIVLQFAGLLDKLLLQVACLGPLLVYFDQQLAIVLLQLLPLAQYLPQLVVYGPFAKQVEQFGGLGRYKSSWQHRFYLVVRCCCGRSVGSRFGLSCDGQILFGLVVGVEYEAAVFYQSVSLFEYFFEPVEVGLQVFVCPFLVIQLLLLV